MNKKGTAIALVLLFLLLFRKAKEKTGTTVDQPSFAFLGPDQNGNLQLGVHGVQSHVLSVNDTKVIDGYRFTLTKGTTSYGLAIFKGEKPILANLYDFNGNYIKSII